MTEVKEPMIYKAISTVMEDIGIVGKDSTNKQQGYKFRGIDAVMNALNPALVKNKVFVVPEVLEQRREERSSRGGGVLIYSICKIKYTFFTVDGSSVCAIVIGEGMDSGDKATNKAMSIAFKYACFQVFCIPTEELIEEPDKETHELASKGKPTPAVNQKISSEKVTALEEFLKDHGVEVATVCRLYKVKNIADLTETQHANIIKNIKKIKEKQEEKANE